jgi:hypothetical protein
LTYYFVAFGTRACDARYRRSEAAGKTPMAKKNGKSNGNTSHIGGFTAPSEVGEVAVELPIEWHTGPEIISRYANQAVVMSAPNECHVSFFEIRPPHVTGPPEEMQKQAAALKSIRAECVARIVMPHDLLARMAQSFKEILERKQKRESKKGEQASVDTGHDKKESA